MYEYESRKQWGENNRKNKLKNAIRQKHKSRSSKKIDPFKYGYPYKESEECEECEECEYSDENNTLSYLHAKPKCFDLGSVNGIISFLQNREEYTPANYKKLIKLAYRIKNTSHPEHKLFCYDCYSYKCEKNNHINYNAKKKKVNRKFVHFFDKETKKTNKFYRDDWNLTINKKKKPKQYCDVCKVKKKKCIKLYCGKTLCSNCESKMRYSTNGCWFCRTSKCIRTNFSYTIKGHELSNLTSNSVFQSLFAILSEMISSGVNITYE